ncbi:hypothetical protein LTR16_001024 [Cryomyces antarcticus]|uniref:Tail specific protease domain-containing protein n=1 Tax=Cryomyces antarcticus TaxID=329879 RepID=A0ABR0M1U9_9PEZI|nr:hypothetical protein LTR16_001024 [Cryomyces antarcticus]
MLFLPVSFSVVFVALAIARPSAQASTSPTESIGIADYILAAAAPESTACGYIVNQNVYEEQYIFTAKEALDCMISVPFNPAVATRLVSYLNDTLQFQSTLVYLKHPPPSYQQLPTDLIEGLNQLQKDIDDGSFHNQYAFEASLRLVLNSAHDSHIGLNAGIMAQFSFTTSTQLVSVSVDGIQLPKVYAAADLLSYTDGALPPAVTEINGVDITDYLSRFAAINALGTLEPHAEWNQLMSSPALDIQGYYSIFAGSTTFYPGDEVHGDNLTFTYENGNQTTDTWEAFYYGPGYIGPLSTGGDFYNYFVLGYLPASYDPNFVYPNSTDPSSTGPIDTGPFTWNNVSDAYPSNPFLVQEDLGITGGGFLTGYYLHNISTAVLSIPSFDESGDYVGTFSAIVSAFISKSKEAGMQKLLIDVQQNGGGNALLATDTYKRFFPSNEPYGGSRLRAHAAADALGNTVTQYWDNLDDQNYYYYQLTIDEWVATDRLNAATGSNFSSWSEFYGPHRAGEDNFTTVQRYNLSSWIFDVEALGGTDGEAIYNYANNPATESQPLYAAEDIVILSDGLCHSACALFVEMMHHEAGVRTVVVGGKPTYGPMQTPAGSRGAAAYPVDILDNNIVFAQNNNESTKDLLPDRAVDTWITGASINLRDQVRNGSDVPLQFAYEAANCRIFFTPQTVFDFEALWTYAAKAMSTNPEYCVQGSTGYATTADTTITTAPPVEPGAAAINVSAIDLLKGIPTNVLAGLGAPVPDDFFPPGNSHPGASCPASRQIVRSNCSTAQVCASFTGCSKGTPTKESKCVGKCRVDSNQRQTGCSTGYICQPYRKITVSKNVAMHQGYCQPPPQQLNVAKQCPPQTSPDGPINLVP